MNKIGSLHKNILRIVQKVPSLIFRRYFEPWDFVGTPLAAIIHQMVESRLSGTCFLYSDGFLYAQYPPYRTSRIFSSDFLAPAIVVLVFQLLTDDIL